MASIMQGTVVMRFETEPEE